MWLDIDTYGLQAVSEQLLSLSSVSASDLQRVAGRLFREVPIASVVIGNSKQLQATLEPNIKVELMGELETERADKVKSKPVTTIPVKKPE